MGYLLQNGGLGMAGDWIITGGRPLQGRVELPAAKNSVLPLLAAALLCSGPVQLQNVPRLTDVEDCLALLQGVGCTAGWHGAELVVQGQPMRTDLAPEAAGRMRASILFCAPLLARRRANTVLPGAAAWARPIDLHLQGLAQMGVRQGRPLRPDKFTLYAPAGLRGAEICLASFPERGRYRNAAAGRCYGAGQTVLHGAAKEPEIVDLAAFLNVCGGCVEGAGTDTIRRRESAALQAAPLRRVADRIIASTLACAAAAAGGRVELAGCAPGLYAPLLEILEQMGCTVERGAGAMLPPFHGSGRCAAREMCTPHLIPVLPRTPPRCWRRRSAHRAKAACRTGRLNTVLPARRLCGAGGKRPGGQLPARAARRGAARGKADRTGPAGRGSAGDCGTGCPGQQPPWRGGVCPARVCGP